MAITLAWTNRNTIPVTTTIYRGDAPLDRTNLPTPLVTLSNNESQYLDATAIQGNTYYYVFKTASANETIVSRNQKIQAAETRGPGSNVLLYGDRDLGLYDVLSAEQLITAANLNAAVAAVTTASANQYWYKYARNGKVLFVPERPMGYTTTVSSLDTKKLINGETTVVIQGYTFKVRLMRGWSEVGSAAALPSKTGTYPLDMQTIAQTCEFNDLVYPMFAATPIGQRMPNWLSTAALSGTGAQVIIAEKTSEGDTGLVRYFSGITTSERAKIAGLTTVALTLSSTALGWWPVLELVEA